MIVFIFHHMLHKKPLFAYRPACRTVLWVDCWISVLVSFKLTTCHCSDVNSSDVNNKPLVVTLYAITKQYLLLPQQSLLFRHNQCRISLTGHYLLHGVRLQPFWKCRRGVITPQLVKTGNGCRLVNLRVHCDQRKWLLRKGKISGKEISSPLLLFPSLSVAALDPVPPFFAPFPFSSFPFPPYSFIPTRIFIPSPSIPLTLPSQAHFLPL